MEGIRHRDGAKVQKKWRMKNKEWRILWFYVEEQVLATSDKLQSVDKIRVDKEWHTDETDETDERWYLVPQHLECWGYEYKHLWCDEHKPREDTHHHPPCPLQHPCSKAHRPPLLPHPPRKNDVGGGHKGVSHIFREYPHKQIYIPSLNTNPCNCYYFSCRDFQFVQKAFVTWLPSSCHVRCRCRWVIPV